MKRSEQPLATNRAISTIMHCACGGETSGATGTSCRTNVTTSQHKVYFILFLPKCNINVKNVLGDFPPVHHNPATMTLWQWLIIVRVTLAPEVGNLPGGGGGGVISILKGLFTKFFEEKPISSITGRSCFYVLFVTLVFCAQVYSFPLMFCRTPRNLSHLIFSRWFRSQNHFLNRDLFLTTSYEMRFLL